jgi:hypothetical protein
MGWRGDATPYATQAPAASAATMGRVGDVQVLR